MTGVQPPLRRSARNRAPATAPAPAPAPASPPRRSPRKRAAPASVRAAPAKKKAKPPVRSVRAGPHKVKKGLRGAPAVPTDIPLGVVDLASGVDGRIVVLFEHSPDVTVFDVMLVSVDPAKNQDKFIILQLIGENYAPRRVVLYERWGRTGTSGQSMKTMFRTQSWQEAVAAFADKFHQKTGLEWSNRDAPPVPGKYRMVVQDYQAKYDCDSGYWQYWVGHDHVDGKEIGWYYYDELGSLLVEQLYMESLTNDWLTRRVVQSGAYAYLVDLVSMTQTNVVHPDHTVRNIRRIPEYEDADDTPPPGFEFDGTSTTAAPKSEAKPAKVESKPAKVESKPAKVESKPAKVKTKPVKVKTKPVKVKTKPSTVQSKPEPEPESEPDPEPEPKPPAVSVQRKEKNLSVKVENVQLPHQVQPASPATAPVPQKLTTPPVDKGMPGRENFSVVRDATLNQANISGGNNNNKYFILQLLSRTGGTSYTVWTRWGRVGEARSSQTQQMGPYVNLATAERVFNKKFKDKTGNTWGAEEFTPKAGKYDFVEIDHSKTEVDLEPILAAKKEEDVEYLPSTLDEKTRLLVELLFEKDIYNEAMAAFNIDVKRMPLGQLTAAQVQRGVLALKDIETALQATPANRNELERLTSVFYTVIPHFFGRSRPPVISTPDALQRSFDLLDILMDIEKASAMMKEAEDNTSEVTKKILPHPSDTKYHTLGANLQLVDCNSREYANVKAAFDETKGESYKSTELLDVWRIDRKGEADRFEKVSGIGNRKMLWHGTNIAVVAAIMSSGLRIMPHSGGRVGKGLYLASECGKSQGYTIPAFSRQTACMFLVEAALGKQKEIFTDDGTLTCAPHGFDSVHARGRQTPSSYKKLNFDGREVRLPHGVPRNDPKARNSSFIQDELLVYDEQQVRMRYVITVKK